MWNLGEFGTMVQQEFFNKSGRNCKICVDHTCPFLTCFGVQASKQFHLAISTLFESSSVTFASSVRFCTKPSRKVRLAERLLHNEQSAWWASNIFYASIEKWFPGTGLVVAALRGCMSSQMNLMFHICDVHGILESKGYRGIAMMLAIVWAFVGISTA